MKIAFIHNEKKINTGAHYINDLITTKLTEKGNEISNFYPSSSLMDTPAHLKGIANILYFYSLLEFKNKVLKHDIVQGTTYTPLPFLAFDIPVVCHFGSTTHGFLANTPLTAHLKTSADILYELKNQGIIESVNVKTRKPMRDIAEIEHYVASKAAGVIATSEIVKKDLIKTGVAPEKIYVIHNAIEDYWFTAGPRELREQPALVFIGRIGNDPFTFKLKGVDRLIKIFRHFKDLHKISFFMTQNRKLIHWMMDTIPHHRIFPNIKKDTIPAQLTSYFGSILIIPSRYEGFSLSLIEGMSQGLIPIIYSVGVAPEIIDGKNGFIVQDETEAIEKITELTKNMELRKSMAAAAQATARQFTAEIMINKMTAVYQEIIDKRAPAATNNRQLGAVKTS